MEILSLLAAFCTTWMSLTSTGHQHRQRSDNGKVFFSPLSLQGHPPISLNSQFLQKCSQIIYLSLPYLPPCVFPWYIRIQHLWKKKKKGGLNDHMVWLSVKELWFWRNPVFKQESEYLQKKVYCLNGIQKVGVFPVIVNKLIALNITKSFLCYLSTRSSSILAIIKHWHILGIKNFTFLFIYWAFQLLAGWLWEPLLRWVLI